MNLALLIVVLLTPVVLAFATVMLVRNEWVYRNRRKLAGTPDYDRLPSYEAMMRRWWVWDIEKFLL